MEEKWEAIKAALTRSAGHIATVAEQSEMHRTEWFQNKAEEAQMARVGDKVVWQCIWDMQHGWRGLVPSK